MKQADKGATSESSYIETIVKPTIREFNNSIPAAQLVAVWNALKDMEAVLWINLGFRRLCPKVCQLSSFQEEIKIVGFVACVAHFTFL